jgi:ATP-dependent DNA helicase RecG
MGYIEAWGMGIDMMNREMNAAGLPHPEYEDTGASFIVTLTGPGENWMGEAKLPDGLNERQIKAIEYMKEKVSITNREYRTLNQTTKATATRDLRDLVDKAVVRRTGTGKRDAAYTLVSQK